MGRIYVLVLVSCCASCVAASAPVPPLACPAPTPCPPAPAVQLEDIAWPGPPWFEPCHDRMRKLSRLFSRPNGGHSVRAYRAGLDVFVDAFRTAVQIDETATDADKQRLLDSCAQELDRLTDIFRPIDPPRNCQACRLETTSAPDVVSFEAPR